MKKSRILIFLVILFTLCGSVWICFNAVFAINFIFALLSFMLIVWITFSTQRRKINNLTQNLSEQEREALIETYKSKQEKLEELEYEFWQDYEFKDSKDSKDSATKDSKQKLPKHSFINTLKPQNLKLGAKGFFLPLRLIAYGFLVVGILILIDKNIFAPLAFFSGILSANCLLVIFALFLLKFRLN